MEGFYFPHLPCISRIFRPEYSSGREEAMNPCIQAPDIFPQRPGAQGRQNEFCRFVKKYDHIKNTDTIPCSMSPHSRTTSSRRLQDFPVCSALAPDSERPAILTGTDLYPCFCAVFYSSIKGGEEIIISSPPFFCTRNPDALSSPILNELGVCHSLRSAAGVQRRPQGNHCLNSRRA